MNARPWIPRWFMCGAFALIVACSRCDQASDDHGDRFPAVFAALRPSVVLFTMQAPSDDPKKKGVYDEAYGSGFVVESGSWGSRFLTAEHVIEHARRLRVTINNQRAVPARVVVADVGADIAVVQARAPDLPAVRLAFASVPEPGMQIGVAGYPIPDAFAEEHLGQATSVFAGRLSSVRHDALELDMPIIPGESGGPVFDARTGEVIGIAESRFEEERAIGFAIPIQDARRFLQRFPKRHDHPSGAPHVSKYTSEPRLNGPDVRESAVKRFRRP